jgi:hypothetical protein
MRDVRSFLCALLISAALAATVAPTDALGCSCDEGPTFEEAFAQSTAVFRGTVLSIISADPPYFEHVWVSLHADAWWKGAPTETVSMLTAANEGICGYPFVIGTEYLVFATLYGSGGPLSTYLCWRTHQSWAGDPDLVSLGPPYTVSVAQGSWGGIKSLYR